MPTAIEGKMPFRLETAARAGIVTILIGPDRVKYQLHRAVLTQHSECFRRALEGPWREAEEGVVCLEDVEPECFSLFVDWVYSQQPPSFEPYYLSLEYEEKVHLQILRIKACIFADRFLATGYARAMRRRLMFRLIHHESVQWPTVVYAFGNLREDDQILQFLVDMQCYEADVEKEFENDLPRSFMLRALQTFAKWQYLGEKVPRPKVCDYHDHTTEEERKGCEYHEEKQLSN